MPLNYLHILTRELNFQRWCSEIEESTDFWVLTPPQPTSTKSFHQTSSGPKDDSKEAKEKETRFLRYIGGRITRASLFMFSKKDFDCYGNPIRATKESVMIALPTMQDMKKNLSGDKWERIVKIMLKSNITGGSHAITLQTVIDILTFWKAGPMDCILDIGSGMGTTTAIAAIALGAKAVGIEYREDVYHSVQDVVSSIRGVLHN
jgi:Protein-L-isoaspartate(D-aspartate) O-methyltransferase (PCMT)